MTNFLYFEPLSDGASAVWAEKIIAAALSKPQIDSVTFCASRVLYERVSGEIDRSSISYLPLEEPELRHLLTGSSISRAWKQWSKARQVVREIRSDICFIPYIDRVAFWAGLDRRPFGCRLGGIVLNAPNSFGKPPTFKSKMNHYARWATYSFSRRRELPVLFTLDETLMERPWVRRTDRFCLLHDPAPDKRLFDNLVAKQREDGRRTALLFGHIGRRKGVFGVLEALSSLTANDQKNLAIRLCGRVKPEQLEELEQSIDRAQHDAPHVIIELNNNFLTEEEIAQEVVNASVILMPYEDHVGSSGVLYWAAVARRPVISQKTGLIGHQVTKYNLGWAVDTGNKEEIAGALAREPPIYQGQAEQFVEGNTWKDFGDRILNRLLA